MLTTFEALEQRAYDNNILLLDTPLPPGIDGYFYANSEYHLNTITLNSCLNTTCERRCVLAEELGHYFTTPVDLFRAPKTLQDKYEHMAKAWAANTLVPAFKLIEAWQVGIRTSWELAEYLNITECFLRHALHAYQEKYGPCVECSTHIIQFCPLIIEEIDAHGFNQ